MSTNCTCCHKPVHDLADHVLHLRRCQDLELCQICDILFPLGHRLRNHRRQTHSHRKKWSCTACRAEYEHPEELEAHLALSSSSACLRPCPEPGCVLRFADRWILARHRASAHPAQEYGRRFSRVAGRSDWQRMGPVR